MAYWVNHLLGDAGELPVHVFASLYTELANADDEHSDVSVTHGFELCLAAFSDGL